MSHTARSILDASPRFRQIAVSEALDVMAKENGQSYEATCNAFLAGHPVINREVGKLVIKSAEELARQLNEGAQHAG